MTTPDRRGFGLLPRRHACMIQPCHSLLSLGKGALYNPGERVARKGRGPRSLMGDRPKDTDG